MHACPLGMRDSHLECMPTQFEKPSVHLSTPLFGLAPPPSNTLNVLARAALKPLPHFKLALQTPAPPASSPALSAPTGPAVRTLVAHPCPSRSLRTHGRTTHARHRHTPTLVAHANPSRTPILRARTPVAPPVPQCRSYLCPARTLLAHSNPSRMQNRRPHARPPCSSPSDGATHSTTAVHSGCATFPSPTPLGSPPSATLTARRLPHPVGRGPDSCMPQARRAPPVACAVAAATIPHIRLSGHDHLRAHAVIACPTPPVEATTPAYLRHDAHRPLHAQRAQQRLPIVHAASVAPSGTVATLRAPTPCCSTSPRTRRNSTSAPQHMRPRRREASATIGCRTAAPAASPLVVPPRALPRIGAPLTMQAALKPAITMPRASRHTSPRTLPRSRRLTTRRPRCDPSVHRGATPSRTLPPYILPPRLGRDVLHPSRRAPLSP
ncbi:hypothetical protein K438DRAFT_1991553 [Mycena galopus ATCC 62051]|nr:hypothetical protein K438DRAFT_1991553 [Mycena galopus ATCC 62051]